MKIAVTYENGEIFGHFGHTKQFKVYETENGKILSSKVVDTNGSGHGALAGMLSALDIDVLNVMKKALCIISVLLCILLTACENDSSIGIIGGADGPTSIIVAEKGEKAMYEQITPEEAKKIMDSGEEHIVLDTREQDEFDEGHIPNAILIPYTEIENNAIEMIPDKDKLILVYCRSGRRSKIAAESLAKLGYTNVKEFGGIIDWPYEVEK